MDLRIIVRADSAYGYWEEATISIGEPFVKAFAPLRTTDDYFMCIASQGTKIMNESFAAREVWKFRGEAAEEISSAITEQLLKMMKKKDTFNGYEEN